MNITELFYSNLFFIALLLIIVVFGLYGLPSDFKVDPEYIVGILTASSILFGFWVFIIETITEVRSTQRRVRYYKDMRPYFSTSFLLLLFSVFFTYFAALNKIPSAYALSICTVSFFVNVWFLVYFLSLRESRDQIKQE